MFFKKEAKLMDRVENGEGYWGIVRRRFRKNRMAVWSLRFLYLLLFIAVFADFIANDKPLYCKIEGESHFPVLKQYAVDLGWSRWEKPLNTDDWQDYDYESSIMPPIPYSYKSIDYSNNDYVSPTGKQRVDSWRYRHWLGTDQIGRDVAAGMVAGTRIAVLVGVISMSVAAFIGILLGALAGYFGDDALRLPRIRVIFMLVGAFFGIFWGFIARGYSISEGNTGVEVIKGFFIFLTITALFYLLAYPFRKIKAFSKPIRIPFDLIIMRLIEIINSIPGLLLLLSIAAIIKKPSIFYIMLIIGFIRWTGIARFIRAELLRIRKREYIEAARALGYNEWHILLKHAIPNALSPVLITISFGIASAILLEAFLSFLGIGLAPETVSWGTLLSGARSYPGAWWLALFPGFAIFFTVTLFNLIGEGLTEAMDPKG